jgi:Uma2 family endonuclease
MTAVHERPLDERPYVSAEAFKEIARIDERDDIRLEFINGRMWEKPGPDGDHDEIIMWLLERCLQQRVDLRLYPERGLRIPSCRGGHARPNGTLAPKGSFGGQGEWASADQVLMVVEVTPYDSDTDQRDRVHKPRAYAETGIPVYLLIDRDTCEVVIHSEPDGTRYESVRRLPFGKPAELPAPVDITLDTEPLKDWAN